MNINQKLNEYLTENGIKQCFVSQKTNIPKVAMEIGGGNTEDSVRKVCSRYLEKHGD